MSELAVRDHYTTAVDIPNGQDQAIARLAEWARAASAAYEVATRLCGTQFAPVAYRGKPDEATAAILAGAEVGLSPMASLRAFDNIQGTPAPKAMTLRAIVQSIGHEVRIDESTPDRAVVSGRRKDSSEWQTSTWDIARATVMGLTGKEQWKKQPDAMLVARATAEVCRWIASDAIMGMPYSSEEVHDQGAEFEPRPVARRVTAAEILGVADTPADTPTPAAAPDADSAAESDNAVGMTTRRQQREMFAMWADLGYGGDDNRAQRLQITAKILGLDEAPESSNDLTEADADKVIAALRTRQANQGGAPRTGGGS